MSRGVRCGIVSTPVNRSIATDAMIPLIRARARGLSFTSTNCALPESRTARAVASSASGFAPSGGSSCTETTNVPSSSIRCELRRRVACADGHRALALADEQRRRRRGVLVDRRADRGDLRRRRAAAAADDRAHRARVPAPRTRRSTRASRAGRRSAVPDMLARPTFGSAASGAPTLHLRERAQRRRRPGAVVRAERGDAERCAAARPLCCGRDAGERLAVAESKLISATIGRLDTERIAATAVSRSSRSENVSTKKSSTPRPRARRLLGVQRAGSARAAQLAARPDRARDEDFAAGDLARLARELAPRRSLIRSNSSSRKCCGELRRGSRRTCSSRSARRRRGCSRGARRGRSRAP